MQLTMVVMSWGAAAGATGDAGARATGVAGVTGDAGAEGAAGSGATGGLDSSFVTLACFESS